MSQHDFNIANQGFPAFRADLNDALLAIRSTNSGATAPTPTVAGMLWYDTTNSILKRRNTANTAWVDVNSDTVGALTVRGNASSSAAVQTDLSMASLRTIIGFPTASAGLGQWTRTVSASSGAAVSLPAGGSWAYFLIVTSATSGTVALITAGVLAGGSILYQNVGDVGNALCWRIA